jgi:D-serine deaminase-like pyridoxal phosphate-dependent protein
MTLPDQTVRLLSGVTIDETNKGFPAVDRPVPLLDVGDRGWTVDDLPPPFCALRRSALEHNLRVMAAYCEPRGIAIAPHGKTTMAPQLWSRQLAAGAWGISAAGAGQARVMRAAGVGRVLLANELADRASISWAAADLAREDHELLCQVDSTSGVAALEDGLSESGTARPLLVLVEIGHAAGRTGCRDLESALDVAAAVERSDRLRFAGVTGYEGTLAEDRSAASLGRVRAFVGELRATAATLFERHPPAATPIVSAGGSMFFDVVADVLSARWEDSVAVIIRPGCYVTHDAGYYEKSSPLRPEPPDGRFRSALEVWASVLSIPEPDLAILALGRRDVPFDHGPPRPLMIRRPDRSLERIDGHLEVVRLNDQHAYCRSSGERSLAVGDLVMCGISHPCGAFDRWRVIAELDDEDRVVDAIATFF